MTEIRTKFLFRLALDVGVHHVVGPMPFGSRRVAPIAGGTFEGPQLSGIVLPGGTDWITEDAAGCWFRINVRVPLRTHDGDLLTMAYQGFRMRPARSARRSRAERASMRTATTTACQAPSRRHRPGWLASTRWLSSPAAGGPPPVQDTTSSRCSDRIGPMVVGTRSKGRFWHRAADLGDE